MKDLKNYKTEARPKIRKTNTGLIKEMLTHLRIRPHTEKELVDLGIESPDNMRKYCRKCGHNVKIRTQSVRKDVFDMNKNSIKTFYLKDND